MKKLIGLTLMCLLVHAISFAGNYTWTGTINSSWDSTGNWNPAGVPTSNDTININSTTNSLALDGNRTVRRIVMNSDTLDLGGDTLTITVSAGMNGGSINNGVYNANCSGLLNFAGTTFGAVVVAKGQIKLNGCIFNTTASFEHIGSAAGVGTGGNTFNGVTTLKNTGTTTLRLGGTNSDTFNDDVYIINSSAMVGSGSLQLSYGATSYFNGNLIVSSTTVFGISFSGAGSGSSVLDTGKTITIGSAGFGGTLLLRNFTQLHSTAQSMTLSGALNLVNSTFNGPLTCTSGNILLSGNNFHGATSFTKTGPSSDYSAGGNHFFQSVTVSNNTTNSAIVRFAATSGDIYYNDVALNTNTGFIQLAYSDTNEFKGDLTINSSKVTFNNGNGILQCTGGNTQEFGGNAPFVVGKLWMNKSTSTLTLQKAVTIDSLLTLTSGIVYADSTNLLTLKAGGATSGASDLSFIDGPMKKIGNTAFVFPIGNSSYHSPIKIGNSSSATNAFYARNYHLEPEYSEFSDSSIDFVNPCEFWELKQIIGSDSITLGIAHDSSRCLYSNSGNSTVLRQLINNWVDIGNSFDTLGFLNSIYKQTGSIIITSGLKSLFKNRISLLDNYAVIGKNSVQSDRDIRIDGNICSVGSISNVILSSDSVFSIGDCALTVSCSDSLIEMIRNFKGKNLNALINGNSFTHGIYYSSTSIHLDSTVHLIGDSNSKFIFIANDSIIFGGMASINFGNVKPYNVVWVSNLGTRISTPVYLSGLFFSKESIIIEDRANYFISTYSSNSVIFKGVSSLRYDSYFYDLNITSPIKFKEAINNTSATNLPICPNIINDGFTSGSYSASAGQRVVVSENGDTYVAGYYRGVLTFGNTTISNLNQGLLNQGTFVAKYDDCGNLIWVTGPTGFYSGGPTGITIDENRGILYVLGQYIGANTGSNMNFGSCATCSIIGNDINGVYLVAYDIASGNALWAKTINATYGANSYNAVVDHSGNLNINFAWFLNGGSNGAIGTVDGSSIPPPLNPLSASHHIAQFDPNGTLSWINLIDGNLFLNRNNPRQGLAVDNQNNIYVAGIFGDFLNAGPVNLTTTSQYDIDLFFYSCGQNGSFRWVNQIGSQSVPNFGYELEGTNHLIVDNENNVLLYTSLLTNAFIPNSPLSLQGVTLTNSGLLDSYLLKFDINGNLIYNTGQAWITNFFGSGPNDRVTIGRFVQDQGQNDYYTLLGYKLAGNLVSVNDCIGCLTSTNTAQSTSPFLTRIDKSGVLSLATTLGNNNGAGWNDLGTSMGGYYKVTGGFVGNMTYLNTSLTSSLPTNQNMSLIVNQIPVINTSNNSNAQCVDFPITLSTNPGVSYLWSTGETSSTIVAENSGTYSVTITQYCGCTSTASIILHGIYVEPLVTQQISCINSTGAAQINIINGTGPFTYLWNPGGITTNSINNLATGTYFCTVTDVGGCSVTTSINIGNYINGVPIALKGDIYECSSDDIYSVVNPIPGVPYSYEIIDNNGSTVSNTGSSVTISQGSVALPFTVTFYSYAGTQCEKSASLDVYPCCYGSINENDPGSTLTFTDIKASDLLTLPNLSGYFTGGNTLTLTQTNSLTNAIAINGTFTVDMDFNFASCHILMGPNSKIVVESPYLLTCVNRVYFHSCGSYMWKGIHLESGGANMKGIHWYIEDAKTALFVGTGSNYLFQDTYFNKNWVAIDLEADMDKISNLTSCTIECVDQLFLPNTFTLNPTPIPSTIQLPPHVNQRSFIGIDVKDVVDDINSSTTYVGLQIGAESWPNNIGGNNPYLGCNPCSSNTFYHLDIAIRGVNSDMLIINNNFKGIDNASNPVAEGTHLHLQPGTAILSNHSNRPEPNKLYIGTDNNGAFNTLYKNTFEDGKRGVLLLNNVNGIIKFNTFTGMTGSGVQLRSGINQDLEILNNTFIDCSRGVFLRNASNLNGSTELIKVESNIFDYSWSSNLGVLPGTSLPMFALVTAGSAKPINLLIKNNNIQRAKTGISLNNYGSKLFYLEVSNNTIGLDNDINKSLYGIRSVNCRYVQIKQNGIGKLGTSTGLTPIGISLESALKNQLYENTLYRMGSGIGAFNSVMPSTLQCNYMDDNETGVYFQNSNLGVQGSANLPSDNQFVSSNFSDIQANNSSQVQNTWWTRSTVLPWASSNQIPTFPSNPINFNLVSISPIPAENCDNPCMGPGCDQNRLLFIVENDSDFQQLSAEAQYLAKLNAFRIIQEDTSIFNMNLPSDSLYKIFYDSMIQVNAGYIQYVEHSIQELDTAEARNYNEFITPDNEIEYYLKIVTQIYLDTWARGNFDLDSTTTEILMEVSHLSPEYFGEAVYLARALLDEYLDDYPYEEGSNRMSLSKHKKDAGFFIFPNPSISGIFTILNNGEVLRNCTLTVYSMEGRLIHSQLISNYDKWLQVDLSSQKAGTFFVKIISGENIMINSIIKLE